MPQWNPDNKWEGRDVYIIGGGSSLEGFDWGMLKDELTIGCNSAYRLGPDICDICIFGDLKFWHNYKQDLFNFKNPVFTNSKYLQCGEEECPEWLYTMPRKQNGLFLDALGWAGNTGSSAINLAILLGASRVLLLGFDMHLNNKGENNWHQHGLDKVTNVHFNRFIKGFEGVAKDWRSKFPDVDIINLNLDSSLDCFPKMSFDHFKSEQKAS